MTYVYNSWVNRKIKEWFIIDYNLSQRVAVSPLATWFRPGDIGLMGRPCTHESLSGKQGKPGGLMVQTSGAKCGDPDMSTRGSWIVLLSHLKRRPRIGAGCDTSGWMEMAAPDRPRMWDIRVNGNGGPGQSPGVRHPGGWKRRPRTSAKCEISG